MKTANGKIKLYKGLIYSALLLFIFLSTFLSTYHNHDFGETNEDCPAYILSITFHSSDSVSFEPIGKVFLGNYTLLSQSNETANYEIFTTTPSGRSPPPAI
jgi:hypothetical protein